MPIKMTSLAFAFSAAACLYGAAADAKDITAAQAERLLEYHLRDLGLSRLAGFSVERFESSSLPSFYFFSAMFDNPEGSVVLGNYAIDRQTADIWDASICREKHSPSATAFQRQLRDQLHMNPRSYRRLRRPGPSC